ncbi:MAG: A/G-specific adenine glycosylase [Proteobacteria bacterium]|nr:A/G-specific adenine glycosylase [Pseudomonadota bacterium]
MSTSRRSRSAAALLAWYVRARKPLPWRDDPSPYRVWVGEVMSQQTALPIAARRFEELVAELPGVEALAACDEPALGRLWAGLGYYARARNLRRGAAYIAGELGGRFPTDAAGWRLVPGCGPYTAAVIASVCFGERVASVDGNAVRVASRLLALRDPWSKEGGRAIAELLGAMVGGAERPGDLNQAIMELGQEICAVRSPRCGECPVAIACAARREGIVDLCPPPKPRPAPVDVALAAIVLRRASTGRIALARRTDGFLSGTIGFPLAPPEIAAALGARLLEGGFRHTITRHRLTCSVAVVECRGASRAFPKPLLALVEPKPLWLTPAQAESRLEASLDRKAMAVLREASGTKASGTKASGTKASGTTGTWGTGGIAGSQWF